MNRFLLFTITTVLSLILLIACSKDPAPPSLDCSTVTNKAFNADILPIFQNSCATTSCHAAGSVNGPGALVNYNQIAAAASRIRTAVANGSMPQNSSLSTAQKNSILCWIDSGFPNN